MKCSSMTAPSAGHVFRTRQPRIFSLEEARAISAATGELFEREGIQSLCAVVPLTSAPQRASTLNEGLRWPKASPSEYRGSRFRIRRRSA